MQMYSHKGCNACLAVACCSQVCDPYKKAVREKYNLVVKIDKISLAEMEVAIFRFLMYGHRVEGLAHLTRGSDGSLIIRLKVTDTTVEQLRLNFKIGVPV